MRSLFAALVTAIVAGMPAQAQQYPAHPVKIIVGFAAGSGPDVLARAVAIQLSADLGQNRVMIEGCTLWGMPKVEDLPGGGKRFAPCKNTVVVIEGGRVSLNGNDIGTVQPHDTVLVKNGSAKIQSQSD